MLFFLLIGLGSIAAILDWILNHILLFYLIVALKSIFIFVFPMLQKSRPLSVYAGYAALILTDAAHSSLALYYLALAVADIFEEDLFGFIMGLFALVFFVCILMLIDIAPIGLIYFLFDEPEFKSVGEVLIAIALEAIDIVVIFLFARWMF